jgi:hypothetical protein
MIRIVRMEGWMRMWIVIGLQRLSLQFLQVELVLTHSRSPLLIGHTSSYARREKRAHFTVPPC